MSSRGAGIAGNPVLIGAATVLVVLVAVFLAYNANQGLPFVPTYSLKAEVPSAAEPRARQRGPHRRLARRHRRRDHRAAPRRRHQRRRARRSSSSATRMPLPKDSTLLIRSKSALGLKYVELTRGALGRRLRRRRHDPAHAPPRPRRSSSTSS